MCVGVEWLPRARRRLPDRLEDWIGEDNPVRVIDAFVDGLDLIGLGFAGAAATGRPGYLNRIQSSRLNSGELVSFAVNITDRGVRRIKQESQAMGRYLDSRRLFTCQGGRSYQSS